MVGGAYSYSQEIKIFRSANAVTATGNLILPFEQVMLDAILKFKRGMRADAHVYRKSLINLTPVLIKLKRGFSNLILIFVRGPTPGQGPHDSNETDMLN